MEAVDVSGLHPSFAATVLLCASRKGQPMSGIGPVTRDIAQGRDLLGASALVESNNASVHLSGPDDHLRLVLQRGETVLTVLPRDVLPTMTPDVWPTLHLDGQARDGWWVSEHDVVDALIALANVPFPTATVVLSGRRHWRAEELLHEANMLNRRWEAGIEGNFSVDVLAEPQRPLVRVQPVTFDEKEPDFALLHELMLTHQSEGWRPQMTVREALMHHFALLDALNRS